MSRQGVVDRMVSHLDIPATIGPLLGVKNNADEYSLGYNLFGPVKRDYTVVGDWDSIGLVTKQYKARFPLRNVMVFQTKVTNRHDRPIDEPGLFYDAHQKTLNTIIGSLSKFGYKQ